MPPEQILQAHDRLDVVARRVEPDDDVATPVGQPFEGRQEDLIFVVAGAVGLNAGPEVLGRADGDAFTGSGLKIARATAESSPSVITFTTAAIASLRSPAR